MTDSGLAVYPFNAVKHVWTCWKTPHAEYSRHKQKTGIYALLHLCRHLQPRIDKFWTFFARTLSGLSRNNPKWSKCSRFPIEEDKINEWFDHEVPSEGNEDNKVIQIMNVDRLGKQNEITKYTWGINQKTFQCRFQRIISNSLFMEPTIKAQKRSSKKVFFLAKDEQGKTSVMDLGFVWALTLRKPLCGQDTNFRTEKPFSSIT